MKFTGKRLLKNLSPKSKRDIGASGEDYACKILKARGMKIIERNFRTRLGEIDIIARDGEYTVFVEVRLRKDNDFGTPAETIDVRKRAKVIKAAKEYALKNHIYDSPMRFDAVVITGDDPHGFKAEVIENAFEL